MRVRTLRAAALIALFVPAPALGQSSQPSDTVKTVEFEAKSIGRKTKYNVVLPRDSRAVGNSPGC